VQTIHSCHGRRQLKTHIDSKERSYLGPELRPHFILSQYKIEGTAIVAFRGPCDVKTANLVDWEDRLANDSIKAKEMVHFLGEFFGITLREGVWIQRLIVSDFTTELNALGVKATRSGDDIFIDGKKLSVSIVTASPVSVLLHLGINVDAKGAPVKAIGLQDILSEKQIDKLVERVLKNFQSEFKSVERATVKVRPVI
jgi:uncharacterized protein